VIPLHECSSVLSTSSRLPGALRPDSEPSTSSSSQELPEPALSTDSAGAPAAKRPRPDENANPADKGANLMCRHEAYTSAAADKSLHDRCPAEGLVFSPILIHERNLQAKLFTALSNLSANFVTLLEGDFATLPVGSISDVPRSAAADSTAPESELKMVIADAIHQLDECQTACRDLQQLHAHTMQSRCLTKDGALTGPHLPRYRGWLRRVGQAPLPRSTITTASPAGTIVALSTTMCA
jgi:hypothetical protein